MARGWSVDGVECNPHSPHWPQTIHSIDLLHFADVVSASNPSPLNKVFLVPYFFPMFLVLVAVDAM